MTNSFSVGDWIFNNVPVTINGSNATQNFNGLCFGDTNGSYNPPLKVIEQLTNRKLLPVI